MDEQQSKEFAAMVDSVRARHGELVADFDISQLPCQLLAQFFYTLLALHNE
jgi:hypothetical protein